MNTLITNEWIRADIYKPPRGRLVLCRFKDGHYNVCCHNGMYWVGQYGSRLLTDDEPKYFYIFEKFNEIEIV